MEESMDEWDPEEETYYKCHLDGSENSFLYLAELCLQGFSPFRISIRCKDFSQGEECSACVKMPLCPLQECLPICEVNLRGKDQIKQGLHWSIMGLFLFLIRIYHLLGYTLLNFSVVKTSIKIVLLCTLVTVFFIPQLS